MMPPRGPAPRPLSAGAALLSPKFKVPRGVLLAEPRRRKIRPAWNPRDPAMPVACAGPKLGFARVGAGTRVTWTMSGDMGSNVFFHWRDAEKP